MEPTQHNHISEEEQHQESAQSDCIDLRTITAGCRDGAVDDQLLAATGSGSPPTDCQIVTDPCAIAATVSHGTTLDFISALLRRKPVDGRLAVNWIDFGYDSLGFMVNLLKGSMSESIRTCLGVEIDNICHVNPHSTIFTRESWWTEPRRHDKRDTLELTPDLPLVISLNAPVYPECCRQIADLSEGWDTLLLMRLHKEDSSGLDLTPFREHLAENGFLYLAKFNQAPVDYPSTGYIDKGDRLYLFARPLHQGM